MLRGPPSPEIREITTEILHVPGRATDLLLEIISHKLEGAVLGTARVPYLNMAKQTIPKGVELQSDLVTA
jgi:hypothetical protein